MIHGLIELNRAQYSQCSANTFYKMFYLLPASSSSSSWMSSSSFSISWNNRCIIILHKPEWINEVLMSHSISAVEKFMWVDDCQLNYVVFLFPFLFCFVLFSSFFLNSFQDYNGIKCLMVCFTWLIPCTMKLNNECPRNIGGFWSSNINNNNKIIISQNMTAYLVSQCTDRFIFDFFLILASATNNAQIDRPNSFRAFFLFIFSSHQKPNYSFTLFGKHQTKTPLFIWARQSTFMHLMAIW